jgi:hypothetical protein
MKSMMVTAADPLIRSTSRSASTKYSNTVVSTQKFAPEQIEPQALYSGDTARNVESV